MAAINNKHGLKAGNLLPNELLERIFLDFNTQEANHCSQVCLQWNHYIKATNQNNPLLLPRVAGIIIRHLKAPAEIKKCREVCKLWKYGIDLLISKSKVQICLNTAVSWYIEHLDRSKAERISERLFEIDAVPWNPFPNGCVRLWFLGFATGGMPYGEHIAGYCQLIRSKAYHITSLTITLTQCAYNSYCCFNNLLGAHFILKSLCHMINLVELVVHTSLGCHSCILVGDNVRLMKIYLAKINRLRGQAKINSKLKKVCLHIYFPKVGEPVPELVVRIMNVCPNIESLKIGNMNTMGSVLQPSDDLLEYLASVNLPKLEKLIIGGFKTSSNQAAVTTQQAFERNLKVFKLVGIWDRSCCPIKWDRYQGRASKTRNSVPQLSKSWQWCFLCCCPCKCCWS